MKRNKLFFCTLLIAALALVIPACGGSSGGGGGGHADGTFIKSDGLGTDSAWGAHFTSSFDTIRYMHLYPAYDIQGSGNIITLRLRYEYDLVSGFTCPNTTIKMGHTSETTLSTTFDDNIEQGKGSFITVVDDSTVTIPAGSAGDYFDIPLSTAFYYNGVDNLVVQISRTAACTGSVELDAGAPLVGAYTPSIFSIASATATTGGTDTNNILAKFVFEGGDNTLFSNPTDSASVPFTDVAESQRQQQLYLASDINGSGPITGLGIQVASLTTEQTYTVTVNLGHATVTTLAPDYDANYSDSPVTVADAVSFTIPADVPANSYVWIPLPDDVFTYNGTDNLILEFDVTAATGVTAYTYHDHGSGDVRLIYGPSDASVIDPVDTAIHHIKLRFNGGTIDTLTAEVSFDGIPFNIPANQRQYLYRASELGTGGRINRLALRAYNDTLASDYANFTVVLGHTSATELTGTFADNMDDATTVFSGTFSIASGLKVGDWIEIPLTPSFRYNGIDNLVVYTSTDGGTANNIVFGAFSTLYTNRYAYRWDNTSSTAGGISDFLVDQRLWLQ